MIIISALFQSIYSVWNRQRKIVEFISLYGLIEIFLLRHSHLPIPLQIFWL